MRALSLGDVFAPGESCDVDTMALERYAASPPMLTVVVMAYLPSLAWRLDQLVCSYVRRSVLRRDDFDRRPARTW